MADTLSTWDVEQLISLKEYAQKDPYDEEDMRLLMKGQGDIPGDHPEFSRVILNDTCRVVFTNEWQPIGLCRHASLSFKKGSNVSEQTTAKILMFLGYDDKNKIHTWVEKDVILHTIQLI